MQNSTFFDNLAENWDNTRMPDTEKITQLIQLIGLRPGDRVLDSGCGTGVLIPFVKNVVGPEGSIVALDYSQNMIARAVAKYGDLGGINFIVCDIMEHENELYDTVICFNFFPHIQDKPRFFRRVSDLLEEEGSLIIMHDISRHTVNGVHQSCEAVENDLLPPGETVKKWLLDAGYVVQLVIDSDDRYFIKAVKIL
jgi:demethylmenaquinone methyltransferase/2-methoxy-6-polyprenyl-1,4-benzoquinol methylase